MKKKTIAILLILVIGMVGVFAEGEPPVASSTKDLLLKATVASVNRMAISADDPDDFEWGSDDFSSAYSSNAFSDITDDDHFTPVNGSVIAYLYAQSNNKGGVTLEMQAYPLADLSISQYIDYSATVEVVVSGTTVKKTSTTEDDDNGDSVTIVTMAYADKMFDFQSPIYLKLNESLLNAAAGEYEGKIAFTFTAP